MQLFRSLVAHGEKYCRLRIATRQRSTPTELRNVGRPLRRRRRLDAGVDKFDAKIRRTLLAMEPASGKEGGRARGVSSGSPSLASLLGSTKLGDSREQIV